MKADVQYNDYVGTSAADISDYQNLDDILKEWGVNTERFYPVGISFFAGDAGSCYLNILCEDKERNDGKIVKIRYAKEPGYSVQDVMQLFKRFEVIITRKEFQTRELEEEPVLYIE